MKQLLLFSLAILCLISFNYSQKLEPTESQVLVEVYVHDNTGKALGDEDVSFFGRRTKQTYHVVTNDEGKSQLLLPKNDVYEVSYKDLLKKKDYAIIEVPYEEGLITYSVEIIYEPTRVFTLENVYFEFGKSTLKPESFPALNELVELLKAEPTMEIEISGHTDNVGTPQSNMILSQNRAESVRQYLISKGIAQGRVKAVGYGDTKPVATNETDEGRQMNRRTEVKILNK
jgi:OmpA-OmpF porin, OOP family